MSTEENNKNDQKSVIKATGSSVFASYDDKRK
jgi:hypothetical protein